MRKMKDSGIEWIGEIPEDWKLSRIKFLSRVLRGASPRPIDNPVYFDPKGKFSWVRISDVTTSNHYLYNAGEKLSELGASKSVKIEPNNLFISICATVGKPCISKINCCIHDGFVYFPNLEKTFTEYLYWIFFSGTCYQGLGNWGTQLNLNTNIIGNIHIAYPSENKRKIITNYINICCDRIDTLIKKEQQVIEKLKAYRQSVISEAVTRGLAPDAPMKDSGIAICGTIPVEWNISRIKYLFKLREEKNHQPLNRVKLLSLYTDIGVFPHGEQEERGNKAVTADGYKIVHKNDIVVNIILAWMGAIGISSYDGVTSPAYDIYMPIQNINPTYFHYLFRTKAFSGECYKYGRGIMAMRWRTYSTEFKSIKVPLPPIEVQNDIVSFLNKKVEDIENIIQKKLTVIAKLAEYKKSIIYEYVTGKKEVPAS